MKTLLNRRQFLRTATISAAVGAWHLVPGEVLATAGRVAPSRRVGLGVIGLGIQGMGNMRAFLGHPEIQVVAVCDVHAGQRAKGKQAVDTYYGNSGCAAHKDFRDLIARPDVDAVQITAPHHWHPLIAVEAARRGKHMYQEKPMGWSFRAAHTAEKAVKEHGVVFQFGTQQRSSQEFRRACEIALNGRLGKVHTIKVAMSNSYVFHSQKQAGSRHLPARRNHPSR